MQVLESDQINGAMRSATVVQVWDGNTISLWPPLERDGRQGSVVRIHGMAAPELSDPRGPLARTRMTLLVLGCVVRVGEVRDAQGSAWVCEIHYCGRNLTEHFPEYRVSARPAAPAETAGGAPGSAWRLDP